MLDFSKIEAGKLELSCVDFDPRTVVEEVIEMLAPKASGKGLEFLCDVQPRVPQRVHGDPDRLRQILLNLASNAIKFAERGEVVVRVEPAEPGELKFSVRDTGAGIATDRMGRLFKSFSQVDASTTRRYGGTGLGLAIAKQLTELMGGRIGVESTVGRGSTFWFTARLRPVIAGPARRPSSPTAAGLRGMRVLVVDDHAAFRETLRDQLASWGFDVDTVGSGEEAIRRLTSAAAERRPYRLAVVDLVMPGMDGTAVARAIRADALLSPTVLLMVTSTDNPFDPDEMRRLGFADCLTKPVRQSQLFDAVMDAVIPANSAGPTGPERRDTAASGALSTSLVSADETPPPGVLNGVRVLLAEDNEVNQEVARELLADAGWEVDVVANGAQALRAVEEHFRQHRDDAVLMDCQMPELDGFQAAARIRELERERLGSTCGGARLPIIALTANAVEGDRQRCIAAGMDGYLTKPVDPDALIETVRSMLAQRTSPASVATPAGTSAAAAEHPQAPQSTPASRAVVGGAPIDAESLLHRCRGKASLAERLLTQFEQQLGEQVNAIAESLARRDGQVLARLAHTVKGSAANMSASPVCDAAGELERLGVAADFDAAAASLEELADRVRQCRAFVPAAIEQVRKLGGQRSDAGRVV